MPGPTKPVFCPAAKRPRAADDFITFVYKDMFSLPTHFVIFAGLQILFSLFLPFRYAILPVLFATLSAILPTVHIIFYQGAGAPRSSFMTDCFIGRSTAVLSPSHLNHGGGLNAQNQGVVVLHLGVRFNHPLGVLAPHGKILGDFFFSLNKMLEDNAHEYNFLGLSHWSAGERASKNTHMAVYYFRDLDGLSRFAQADLHVQAARWWMARVGEDSVKHIGIFHETFHAGPQQWETMYHNMAPTLLGAASVPLEAGNEILEQEGIEGQGYACTLDAKPKASMATRMIYNG